ncbi:MAG TPA: TadE/TadG family type IV pilus assembly protein [Thermomicrobiales bacterium]
MMPQIGKVQAASARQGRAQQPAAIQTDGRSAQAIVEFALVSLAFFLIVFGTIDFGRAIFMYSELHNAVREGARVGKVDPTDASAIRAAVQDHAKGLGLTSDSIQISCDGGCSASSESVTVTATVGFRAITQELLGIGPITLRASAKVTVE